MVTLLCFCCEHRNPAGARFCNACGTPLHLRPCKRCETINERAAAHCRHCGETFELDFAALDEAEQPADGVTDTVAAADEVTDPAPAGMPAHRVRAYLLATGIVAATVTGIWFSLRLSPPADATVATSPPPETVDARPAPGTPPDEAVQRSTAGEPPKAAEPSPAAGSPALTEPPAAPRGPAREPGTAPAVPVKAPVVATPDRALEAPRPAAARQSVSNGRRTQRVARPTPEAAPTASTAASRAPMVMAVERPAPTTPARRTRKPREPQALPRGFIRVEPSVPCNEGYVLASGCDVRTMPKGN